MLLLAVFDKRSQVEVALAVGLVAARDVAAVWRPRVLILHVLGVVGLSRKGTSIFLLVPG